MMVCLFGQVAHSQSTTIKITVTGKDTTLAVDFVPLAAITVSTIQFDVQFPVGLTFVDVTSAPQTPSDKQVQFSIPVTGTRNVRVIIFGLGSTSPLIAGSIAKFRFQGAPGTYSLTINGIVASAPDATAVATQGTAGQLVI